MALWQVPIELVPVKWAEEHDYKTDSLYGDDGFDTSCAWKNNQPTQNLDLIFSPIMPKSGSWSEDLLFWGNSKIHDISVWHEEGKILSIGFRLDLRENVSDLIFALCKAAELLNCVLFAPGQQVMFKPNIFELKHYILKSNAAKFVKNQESFLSE